MVEPVAPGSQGKTDEGVSRIAAPLLPPPGAIHAAPHTGADMLDIPNENVTPVEDTATPPTRPPVPVQPPRQPRQSPRQPQMSQPPRTAPAALSLSTGVIPVPQEFDAATDSLLRATLNANRRVHQSFHVLVIPEDNWPRVEPFDDIDATIARVKSLLGTNCHLFVFMGQRLTITKGPNRFLQTPYGSLPLFDIPAPDAVDAEDHGWVGEPMDPAIVGESLGEEAPHGQDTDFDDEEHDGIGSTGDTDLDNALVGPPDIGGGMEDTPVL